MSTMHPFLIAEADDSSRPINQINLIGAILKELEKQKIPNIKTRVLNKIVEAANSIIDEYQRKDIIAKPGAGINAWLASDDTGLSSEFMAITLNERGVRKFAEPMDSDDFGRCIRMLRVCPDLKDKLPLMKQHGPIWSQIVDYWDKLEGYYDNDKKMLSNAIQGIHQEAERQKARAKDESNKENIDLQDDGKRTKRTVRKRARS